MKPEHTSSPDPHNRPDRVTGSGGSASSACLDDDTLVALADGSVAADQRDAALAHIDACPTCAALVGQAARLGAGEERSLGRYRLLDELGAGAMGRVYAAHDPVLNREVALKVLAPGKMDPLVGAARLRREAQMLARLEHPSLARVFDVQQHDATVFIAMELIVGQTLAQWLAANPDPASVIAVFVQAAEGLAAAHAVGVIHRDFKPTNVMVGDDGRVVVLDFGLARDHGLSTTDERPEPLAPPGAFDRTSSAFAGTPRYMAPEQFGGTASPASDQYAFCVALAEGLAGQFPFPTRTLLELADAKLAGALTDDALAAIPRRVRPVLLRGLHPDPLRRWRDMNALALALQSWPQRRWGVLAASFVALTAFTAYAWPRSAVDCELADDSVTSLWTPSRRAEVQRALGGADNSSVAARGDSVLDARASALADAYRTACEEHQRRAQPSEAVFDAKMRCLDRRLRELEATSSFPSELDPQSARETVLLLEELPDLELCDIPTLVQNPAGRPEDPKIAAHVAALELKLELAERELRLGHYPEASAQLEVIVQTAKAVGYAPLIAEATTLFAESLRKRSDERATSVAKDAHGWARQVGNPAAAARAALELVHLTRGAGRLTEAQQWLLEAERDAVLTDEPKIAAHILEAKASIAHRRNALDESLGLHRQASEIYRNLDPRGRSFALSLTFVAKDLRRLERFTEATETLLEARALLVALYGETAPRLADVEFELGMVKLVMDEQHAAIPHLERALELTAIKTGPATKSMLSARTALASAYRDDGRLADAAAQLREALELLDALAAGPREASLVWLNYAKLLVQQGDDDAALAAFEKNRGLVQMMDEGPARTALLGINLRDCADVLDRLGRKPEAKLLRTRASALAQPP